MRHTCTGWLLIGATTILTACGGSTGAGSDASTKSASAPAAAEAPAAQSTVPEHTNSVDAVVQTDDMAKRERVGEPFSEVRITQKSQSAKAAHIALDAPTATELERREAHNRRQPGVLDGRKAYQTGINRLLSATREARKLQQILNWSDTAQGTRQTSLQLSSAGARFLRLGLLIESLPDSALVRVRSADAEQAKQTTGQYINAAIRANIAADGDSADARTYWMPSTLGEATVLEIELPASTDPGLVRFSLPSLVHGVETAIDAAEKLAEAKSACPDVTPDATCSLPPASNAVTAYDYVEGGFSYSCTGTLVANRGTTQQGYLLTANHCLNSQTSASNIETFWFWRPDTCHSETPYAGAQYRSGGATLLFSRPEGSASTRSPTGTDTAFLDLPYTPPAGAMYAGWAFERHTINNGVSYTGLHHPGAELLKRLMRRSDGALRTYAINFGDTSVSTSSDASYPMYGVKWSSGITEGGSSGSALFKDVDTSNPKIIGQLWGGSSSCSNPSGTDFYGRFDLAYENGLVNWLNPGYKFVFRFYRPSNGTHFFSADVDERDSVRATNTAFTYEGPSFMVAPGPGTGLSPVHRFFNRRTGTHFYTINEDEKANVESTLADTFTYEGISWYARKATAPASGTVEVYRFFRRAAGTHLYTTSVEERNSIIANLGHLYTYEGVAYLAWPTN